MSKKYRLFQIDAFTRDKFSGNPAGVITNADGLTDCEMQKIARELNNSETAFILSSKGNDHDVHIRFLRPQTKSLFVVIRLLQRTTPEQLKMD